MLSLLASILLLPTQNLATKPWEPVPFTSVRIQDRFWTPRQKINREVSVRHALNMLEKFGYMSNFDLAAKGARTGFQGLVFMDSDVYKTLESASYVLAQEKDPKLDAQLDAVIARVAAAQAPDGYLDTWFQIKEPERKWQNLRDNHELYCAGHLFEAAVAHHQATGKRNLLDVATKLADHIDRRFGDGPGKRPGYCGHPEIELALVKLSQETKEPRYLKLAEFFVTHRGEHFFAAEHKTPESRYDGSYWLDDVPILTHDRVKGHAVRAAYLMSGCVDVASLTGNSALLAMTQRVWRNTDQKNTYITGGIGPSAHNEGFTEDYDLPNESAYQETCASVALAQWNHRLGLQSGDAKYFDRVERALYNAVLAGVSLSGSKFFYVNPLASAGGHHRSDWFACACCPPNVTRTVASLGGYAYATQGTDLAVNLYLAGTGSAVLGGKTVRWNVKTDYPWDGKITLQLEDSGSFGLRLRIPEWTKGFQLRRNGVSQPTTLERGYALLAGPWKAGDQVELNLPMPVRRVTANPNVKSNRGLVSLARGPLVYCVESADFAGDASKVEGLWLPSESPVVAKKSKLFGGIVTLEAPASKTDTRWTGGLYAESPAPQPVKLTAIPYAYWDNREAGPMRVWLPAQPVPPRDGGLEASAAVTSSFISPYGSITGVNDGVEIQSSLDRPNNLTHFWPHKGTTEWIDYRWQTPVKTDSCQVYWFDDTGRGECRPPASWRILAKVGSGWQPLSPKGGYPVKLNGWIKVEFPAVTTIQLRLEIVQQKEWAVGIQEWKVNPAED